MVFIASIGLHRGGLGSGKNETSMQGIPICIYLAMLYTVVCVDTEPWHDRPQSSGVVDKGNAYRQTQYSLPIYNAPCLTLAANSLQQNIPHVITA